MSAIDSKSLPKVYIEVKEEVIPPLPLGPGVLGVVGTVSFTPKENPYYGSFSSQSEFMNALREQGYSSEQKETTEQGKKEENIIEAAKLAFANGIPQVRCMLSNEEGKLDLEAFGSRYPEIDIMIVQNSLSSKLSAHLTKALQNATPCLGLIGVEESATLGTPQDGLVYVTPCSALGAVAGRIGCLQYYESPTFKGLNYPGDTFFTKTKIDELLKKGILPVAKLPGRGWCICKGIDSTHAKKDGEISVRRIVNYAIRGVSLIGDSFIGQLNTSDGRAALRQKIIEFLTSMERDQALVPMGNANTGKVDPAFLVEVNSNPSDFSQGIVRVNLQIRPVRAMNYIDVTINVRAT